MSKKRCFKCILEKKNFEIGDRHTMYPLEKPYVNLFFHKDCYNQIKPNIEEFVAENMPSIIRYIDGKI